MVASMTGFGKAKLSDGDLDISVEIKSVNHRYFEFSSRVPRSFQFLDDKLKAACQERISRGKVEVFVSVNDMAEDAIEFSINDAYASAYIDVLKKFAKKYKIKDDLKLSRFVGNFDILSANRREIDDEQVTSAVLNTLSLALDNFIEMRRVEGKRLVDDVLSRAEYILKQVEFIESRSPQTVKEYREKIDKKIKELIGDVQIDEQRLLTETAIFADKIAVSEETVRLRSHIDSLRALLDEGGAIGRKLDFIIQEMNRETNTIGSKAQDIEIARVVVDIKSEIEKIREQIQNIE